MDWDDKMQRECGESFIQPLELGLIDKRNKEKVAKAAIQIVLDDDNAENQNLLDPWVKVLETVVKGLQMEFVMEHVIKQIKDVPSSKNQLPKRQLGNKLIFGVARSLGEEGFEKDPCLNKVVMNICTDTNHHIRRDGVIFLKEYLKANRDQIV